MTAPLPTGMMIMTVPATVTAMIISSEEETEYTPPSWETQSPEQPEPAPGGEMDTGGTGTGSSDGTDSGGSDGGESSGMDTTPVE